MFSSRFKLLALTQFALAMVGSTVLPANAAELIRTIDDFNTSQFNSRISLGRADAQVIDKGQSNQAIQIDFNSKANYDSRFTFKPQDVWDWSEVGDFALALDIENTQDTSLFIYMQVGDTTGQTHNRSIVLPPESNQTYYVELAGPDLNRETGLRANPKDWKTDYTPAIWRWGVKKLELDKISHFTININTQVKDRQVVIDNLRLIEAAEFDDTVLVGLVDKFGQASNVDFPTKIESDAELKALADQELAELVSKPWKDRSQYGGWKQGPKLKATGYFRTEKVDDKWWLVDPEGYLFFSNGLANVRMANTTTITGYDFDHSKIKERSADDLTPEDSIAVNRVSDEALATRKVASELRANMFTELPDYDSAMGKHYGYRRSTHVGALERGESYSFYQANLERRYGITDKAKLFDKWRDVTVDRMMSWGFTSFGNWIDPMFYQLNRYPYFANGWIIGDFKTVSSGNDYWSPLPDPFDPLFVERANKTIEQIAKEVQNNPWCIGVFIDNEKSWGQMGKVETQYGVVIDAIKRDAKDSPTKAEFVRLLKDQYQRIENLNLAWQISVKDWAEFENGITLDNFPDTLVEDFSVLLEHYASEYFRVVAKSIKEQMPNHMYLGARLASWGMTPEIRAAQAKHTEVMSYNFYRESIHPDSFEFLAEIDKPSIIGEFHMGSADSGLFNPGLIMATDQTDRARLYTQYVDSVLANPYLVGAHWFQYIDSPVTGRSYDGENYNIGFVSTTDVPYPPMIDAAKAVNKRIYTDRYKNK